jgi:phosphoribosylformylglycinamidine (FGAM) synthase-like amidotransferase family enzyme
MKIGIVNYPGSNCIEETKRYFEFNNNECFYIWHKDSDLSLIENLNLLVIPGGFSFGDRLYEKATGDYKMSPGTMAINSPVTRLIIEAHKRKITILGICNGFQILTQLGLLPGKLELNDCGHFVCKKVSCTLIGQDKSSKLYIANSYGKYVGDGLAFLTYEDGTVAGVYDGGKVFGMMPHPERNNNYEFKQMLFELILPHYRSTLWLKYDKVIKDLMFSEHISYKTSRKYLKTVTYESRTCYSGTRRECRNCRYW